MKNAMSAQNKLKIVVKGGDELIVKVSAQVHRTWNQYRQADKKSPEACGVLIGGYNDNANEIYLEACTTPKKEDERKRTHFKLKALSHQKEVNAAHKLSGGKQFYMGTWHSHPESNPTPSNIDLHDWKKCMKRNPEIRLFVFAIVGIDTVVIYPYRQKN